MKDGSVLKHSLRTGSLSILECFNTHILKSVFGDEASMVMQWTVNPPPKGTTGSIPVISTKFRLVHIMVIIPDCLSGDGSSILPRVAKQYLPSVMAAYRSPKPLVKVRILGGVPNISLSYSGEYTILRSSERWFDSIQ